jgi:hypothetical protein
MAKRAKTAAGGNLGATAAVPAPLRRCGNDMRDRRGLSPCNVGVDATLPLAEAFRKQVVAMRVAEVRRLVERGIERRDLRPDTDVELTHDPYRLLLSGGKLGKGLAARIVDSVLPSITAEAGPRRRREQA